MTPTTENVNAATAEYRRPLFNFFLETRLYAPTSYTTKEHISTICTRRRTMFTIIIVIGAVASILLIAAVLIEPPNSDSQTATMWWFAIESLIIGIVFAVIGYEILALAAVAAAAGSSFMTVIRVQYLAKTS